MTALPDAASRTPVDGDVIQVRVALIGLLISVVASSIIPLFAVMLTVTVFAIYSNGHIADDAVAGGTS